MGSVLSALFALLIVAAFLLTAILLVLLVIAAGLAALLAGRLVLVLITHDILSFVLNSTHP